MDINNVIKRALKTYKISITTKRRAFLKEAARAFREKCEGNGEKRVMALHLGDIKKMIPDIEIYLDELARLTTPDIIARGITEAIVHETCHAEGLNERQAHAATKEIMKALKPMTWKLVKCPKTNANINWGECLRCSDTEKHNDCPILAVREQTQDREHTPDVYHVTELTNPRHAYFNRTIGYAKGWDEDSYISLLIGKATHKTIQAAFPRREVEVGVGRDFGEFRVVGSIDVVSDDTIYELKTYASLGALLKRGEPEPDHVWQVRAYYSLLLVSQPWLARMVKKIKIVYLGKAGRGVKQYAEFKVEPKDISNEILTRAKVLHEALKTNTPPSERCPAWRCGYCDYAESCEGIKHGFKKDDGTFKRFLVQHKRGVEQVAELLRLKGHTISINPLAISDMVIPDPAQKQRPEWDIEDLTTGEKIDVKTTSRSDIWCNAAQLIKAADLDLVYYFVFIKSDEVRRIGSKKLYATRKTAKHDTNQFGEEGFIFNKEVAEAVK